jgi:hypothetical protein
MRNDALLKIDGMRILSEQLGIVEAARFIALMRRDLFDYTKWQRELFKGVPLDELLNDAARYREQTQK